jgi:3-polyprenyl-4-hydroxybenzoate decarboxylase
MSAASPLYNYEGNENVGAAILPAPPPLYHTPQIIEDLVDFIAGKILDRLSAAHEFYAGRRVSPLELKT